MAKKNNFYVVWAGHSPGIYDDWGKCQEQIKGFENAKFKGFQTMDAAEKAFSMGYGRYMKLNSAQSSSLRIRSAVSKPVYPSLAVDAAWNTVTGDMEYRGVDAHSGKEIFKQGPFFDGTNNIGEFLAIVHGLAFLQKQGSKIPVYTDSVTAIAWVRRKQANTKLVQTPRNAIIFELIQRAETWLRTNKWDNPILKWETPVWGEIPADFGRK
ncbi:MAG TPA: ribonuclease H family protein [Tenuifilaceae bacterium]|nr:ribonuclease H family protein [Tenuifilaceae bacterium]